jgi:hypothetical protein
MGQLSLARAELEALAGRGVLDEAALLDLAEARWRTGDLPGAGDAAATLLARGRDDALAFLIAAESVAAHGRPGEARRLAGRALAGITGSLDPVFAGMPRNPLWPDDPASPPGLVPARGTDVGSSDAGHPGSAGHPGHPGSSGRPRHSGSALGADGPASPAAAESFAGGRAALAGGDAGKAALRLSVALRLDPGYAEGVLEAIGTDDHDPGLDLVAGDALRLLGREAEALAAFDRVRSRD